MSDRPEAAEAAWLSDSLLLVVGGLEIEPDDTQATLLAGEDSFDVAVRCISLEGVSDSTGRKVVTAALGEESRGARSSGQLSLGGGKSNGDRRIELKLRDLGTLVGGGLSALDEGAAKLVAEFISAAPAAYAVGEERDLVVSNRLHSLRNALRPRLPAVTIEGDQALTGNVDALVTIDEKSFFVTGWMRDAQARIARLTAVTAEGERVQLLEQIYGLELQEFEMFAEGPYQQPVDATRFIAHFRTTRPSLLRKPWVFEMQDETGHGVEMYALPDVDDARSARTKILRSVPETALPDDDLMTNHVFPAIERLQERARESVEIESIESYGQPPESPAVSIVVPLYERIDLVDHQLLQFNSDPEVQRTDLIYVLDSPELETDLADRARQLARLYQVPFRVVTMAHNSGFGAATNAGVSIARGRLVLLLNSDVLPAEPGWLGTMQAFYDATEGVGALGAKLLYEDDSLQHAGLYFERMLDGPTAGSWANMHYFKGLHRDLPAANVARPVPALTAACLMIDKELYERAGGLPDVYVQGDYEDSELCLRLLEEGRENWYLPAAELYHLEGSSYSPAERGITGSYNRWLQTHRMGQAIEAAMARFPRS